MLFLLSALKLMIEISSKSLHLAGKLISIKKLPISKVKRFLE